MRKLCGFTGYFIIASGESTVQIKAIANAIIERLKKKKVKINHTEGRKEGQWILVDVGQFIVHLFVKELRELYNLEVLWGDAPKIDIGKYGKATT